MNASPPDPVVTLREYIEQCLKCTEEKVAIELRNLREAMAKTKDEMDRRLDGINELRDLLNKQATTFQSRDEYSVRHEELAERINNITSRIDKMEAKGAGMSAFWGYLVAVVGVALGVAGLIYASVKH